MKEYSVYLFDFDGTLVNTIDSLAYVFINALKYFDIDCNENECLEFIRQPLDKTWYDKGGTKENWDEFVKQINFYLNTKETVEHSKIFFDTIEVLSKLKDNGKTLGIVTSNNVPHVKEVCEFLKIDTNLFSVYVGNEHTKNTKPDPEPILKAIEFLPTKYNKNEIVYVGDALNDCLAGVRAGIDAILLDRDEEYKDSPYLKISNLWGLINE